MKIDGVPDSIAWKPVAAFLESLGIDLGALDHTGVRIDRDAITAKVLARNADGKFYIAGREVAMHEISIPITHTDPDC